MAERMNARMVVVAGCTVRAASATESVPAEDESESENQTGSMYIVMQQNHPKEESLRREALVVTCRIEMDWLRHRCATAAILKRIGKRATDKNASLKGDHGYQSNF